MSLPPLENLSISDSPSSPPLPPRDRLTTLPPELFDHICDIVHASNGMDMQTRKRVVTHLGSVSRAFLHRQRLHRFRSVSISSSTRLIDFYIAILVSPGCRSYVVGLSFSFKTARDSGHWRLKDEQLLSLLHNLPALEILRVHQWPSFTRLLCNLPKVISRSMVLKELYLADDFKDWEDPFDPIHWINLSRFPFLDTFGLEVCMSEDAQPPSTYTRCIEPFLDIDDISPVLSVTKLSLKGWVSLSPRLQDLYLTFINVTKLSINEPTTEFGNACQALKIFPYRGILEELDITGSESESYRLETILPDCENLTTLSISQQLYHPNLLPILRDDLTGLRSLSLSAVITSEDLRSLVGGNESLELVTIDEIRLTPKGQPTKLLSSVEKDEYILTFLELINFAALHGVNLVGDAVTWMWSMKNLKERVAKARMEGVVNEDTVRDERSLAFFMYRREAQRLAAGTS